jgi:hypothetical protein
MCIMKVRIFCRIEFCREQDLLSCCPNTATHIVAAGAIIVWLLMIV